MKPHGSGTAKTKRITDKNGGLDVYGWCLILIRIVSIETSIITVNFLSFQLLLMHPPQSDLKLIEFHQSSLWMKDQPFFVHTFCFLLSKFADMNKFGLIAILI